MPDIHPLFAVPFGFAKLESPDALNDRLRALFIDRESQGGSYANPRPFTQRNPQLFESSFDLFKWPDAPVQELKRFCYGHLMRMVGELNQYDEATLQRMVVCADHGAIEVDFFGLLDIVAQRLGIGRQRGLRLSEATLQPREVVPGVRQLRTQLQHGAVGGFGSGELSRPLERLGLLQQATQCVPGTHARALPGALSGCPAGGTSS